MSLELNLTGKTTIITDGAGIGLVIYARYD